MSTSRSLAWLGAALLAACGGSAGTSNTPTPPAQTPVATTVIVAPTQLDLQVGGTGTLVASVRDANGNVLPQAPVTWATQSAAIASVSQGGAVTGVAVGATLVSATSGSAVGGALVNVRALQPTIATLTVSPGSATTTVGGTHPFVAVARDANGTVLPSPSNVVWSSSAPSVATVSQSGAAVGVAVGTAMIGATWGGLAATPATLTVTNPTASRCAGIGAVTTFEFAILLNWNHFGLVNGHKIATAHELTAIDDWKRVDTGDPDELQWEGPVGLFQNGRTIGQANVNDDDEATNNTPVTTAILRAKGAVLQSVAGNPLPHGVLHVDLTTCSFRFQVTPWIPMTLTDHSGKRETADLPMGTVMTKWHPIAPWPAKRYLELLDLPLPAHSISWLAARGGPQDAYIPGGFGPLMFTLGGANEPAAGTANLVVGFNAK